MHQDVTNLFVDLVGRVDPQDTRQMEALKAALFHFRLPPSFAAIATSSVMAVCNRRPVVHGFDSFCSLPSPVLPDGVMPIAAALAVARLRDRGEVITDSFRTPASAWFRGHENIDGKSRDHVIAMIKFTWPGGHDARSPLNPFFSSLRQRVFTKLWVK